MHDDHRHLFTPKKLGYSNRSPTTNIVRCLGSTGHMTHNHCQLKQVWPENPARIIISSTILLV